MRSYDTCTTPRGTDSSDPRRRRELDRLESDSESRPRRGRELDRPRGSGAPGSLGYEPGYATERNRLLEFNKRSHDRGACQGMDLRRLTDGLREGVSSPASSKWTFSL